MKLSNNTFRKWSIRPPTALLHDLFVIRKNKMAFRINSPEERNTLISILHYMWVKLHLIISWLQPKAKMRETWNWIVKWLAKRFTHSSKKCSSVRAVIENKCKFPIEISHNLICRIWTSISQSPVCFYDNGHLICCFVKPILLLEKSNILNMALKQAEYIIHSCKQSGKRKRDQSQSATNMLREKRDKMKWYVVKKAERKKQIHFLSSASC